MSLHEEFKQRAKEQMERGEYGAAIRSITEALDLERDNLTLYLLRGLAYYMRRDYDLAIEDMTAVLTLQHANLDAILTRANAYLQAGKVDQAISDYSEFLNIDPDHPEAPYARRAAAFVSSGDYEAALLDYAAAIERAPDHLQQAKLLFSRATIHYNLGNFEAAEADCSAALQGGYLAPEVYAARGSAYSRLNRLQEALDDFSQAITLDRRDAISLYNRGTVYYRMQRHGEAVDDFSRALKINPEDSAARFARACALYDDGDYRGARQDLSRLIKEQPTYAAAWYMRGLSYHRRGAIDKALPDLEKAVQLSPQNPNYLVALGELELEFEEYDNAIGYLKRALLMHNHSGEELRCRILAALAIGYYLNGRDADAERYWNMLLENDLRYAEIEILQARFKWETPLLEAAAALIEMLESAEE